MKNIQNKNLLLKLYLFLLLAEIEAQAEKTNQFEEKNLDEITKSMIKPD